jgi:hypothetical protein
MRLLYTCHLTPEDESVVRAVVAARLSEMKAEGAVTLEPAEVDAMINAYFRGVAHDGD